MNNKPTTVLIIDDCQEDREIFRRFLDQNTQQTFRILEADCGTDGWELCQTEQPDCILLDYQIPDVDGLEFISSLNHGDNQQEIPVLMLTGQGDETIASEALKGGAADYLVKGKLTNEGLLRAVTRAIEKAALIRKTELQRLEIERSNRELEQFTHRASHDLQAPVRRIITFLDLLQKDLQGSLSESSQDYLDRCLKSAYYMRRLIKDLLDYSRVGGMQKPFSSVDLNQISQQALAQLESTIQETQANITVENLPTILGNEVFLQQLFQNLIGNAIKFRSAKTPDVNISVRDIGASWQLKVSDNGIGMPVESFTKIFEVFQRLDNSQKTEGSGIGLALCKKVVELHGGKIWVDSIEGEGTMFSFTFPKQNVPEKTVAQCVESVSASTYPN